MTGDVTDQLTGKKKSIGWKLVFISWLLFIVIDVFNTGLFVVLFNLAGKYSSSNSVPGHSINWSFEMRYALAGLPYGIYKLSAVPFYWAVLATMVVQIGKFKTIFMSSLVVTVFLVVFCFVSMLLIFYLLVLFRSGQNYLHGLVDFISDLKFDIHACFFSAIITAIMWKKIINYFGLNQLPNNDKR